MMEIAESTKVNKGVNCLKELVKHKNRWVPSKCLELGIYGGISTNAVESIFSELKQK